MVPCYLVPEVRNGKIYLVPGDKVYKMYLMTNGSYENIYLAVKGLNCLLSNIIIIIGKFHVRS